MNISDLSRAEFVYYESYILREFRNFAFKSQWTKNEKKAFFDVFYFFFFFYWINKSILNGCAPRLIL